jgi:hypothetical protein
MINSFKELRNVVGPNGELLGTVKQNLASQTLWEVHLVGHALSIPLHVFNALDYPLTIEVVGADGPLAKIQSGASGRDDFRLEYQQNSYLWKDVSKVRRVMELQLQEKTLARVHSKGTFNVQTFVEAYEELPLLVIGLMFPMYTGVFQSLGA